MTNQAVIYAAKSTEDKKGSIPTQLADARALAEREGLEVVAEFRDEAKSAYRGNRGDGLAQAKAECERIAAKYGKAALVVQHSDRLARGDGKEADSLMHLVIWAMGHSVELLSVQDPEILTTGDYALVMGAIGSMRNHQDSKRKGSGVRDGLRRRVRRGEALGGPVRYGYERLYRPGSKMGEQVSYLVLHEQRAAIVKRIYAEFLAGASHRSIAYGLVRDKVPSPKGGKFSQSTVRSILRSLFYVGILEDRDGNEIEGLHPAIVSRADFDAAQAMSKSQARTGGRPSTGDHLLTKGLLKCGGCGSTLFPRMTRRKAIYYCGGRLEWGVEYCSQSSLDREVVDGALMRYLTKYLLDVTETRRQVQDRTALELTAARGAVTAADGEVAKATARLDRVRRDYLDDEISAAMFRDFLDELEPQLKAASAEAQAALANLERLEASHSEIDVEAETLRVVAEYQALASSVERAGRVDLDALRTTLHQVFASVVYFTPEHFLAKQPMPGKSGTAETGGLGAHEAVWAGGGLLIPMLSDDTILSVDDVGRPEVRRMSVPLAGLVDATFSAGRELNRAA